MSDNGLGNATIDVSMRTAMHYHGTFLMRRSQHLFVVLLLLVVGCVEPIQPRPIGEVLFRDDFNSLELDSGWTFEGDDSSLVELVADSGLIRLAPEMLLSSGEEGAISFLSRKLAGNFIVSTHVTFAPGTDRQVAGLIVTGDDDRKVSIGLIEAALITGTFRGIAAAAELPGGSIPLAKFERVNVSDVFLQLERSEERFTVSYSRDGENFLRIANFETTLSDSVRVGMANLIRETCMQQCDQPTIADFDFFEIRTVVQSVTDSGPS